VNFPALFDEKTALFYYCTFCFGPNHGAFYQIYPMACVRPPSTLQIEGALAALKEL
jgi:hypothetical protein